MALALAGLGSVDDAHRALDLVPRRPPLQPFESRSYDLLDELSAPGAAELRARAAAIP